MTSRFHSSARKKANEKRTLVNTPDFDGISVQLSGTLGDENMAELLTPPTGFSHENADRSNLSSGRDTVYRICHPSGLPFAAAIR